MHITTTCELLFRAPWRAVRPLMAVVGAACFALPTMAEAATQFTYTLDAEYTTSAAIYNQWGNLVTTLWRAERRDPGVHTFTWDNLDRNSNPVQATWVLSTDDMTGEQDVAPVEYQMKVLRHNIDYAWEGVIGNTSAEFNGPGVFRSLNPPRSLAIAGDTLFIAVGYNEGQTGGHGLRVSDPQRRLQPLDPLQEPPWYRAKKGIDPFISLEMVATDGQRLYWVNGGNAAPSAHGHRSFVLVSDIASGDYVSLPAGEMVCLNYRGDGTPRPIDPATYHGHICYEDPYYPSVIDITTDMHFQPTGIAVQSHGPILAVAHGVQGQIKLFDKTTGALLNTLSIPVGNFSVLQNNQLGMAPNGDLWVIVGTTVRRYTNLATTPTLAATAHGFSRPLAVAVHPENDDLVFVADGGTSQKVKGINRHGNQRGWGFGQPTGHPTTDPEVRPDRLSFAFHYTNASAGRSPADTFAITESAGLAVQADGSIWVTDTINGRMLHVGPYANFIEDVAYRPISYVATVDPNNPKRVFSNFLEYEVDTSAPLQPGAGPSWRLVRNWLHGFPHTQIASTNFPWAGFATVTTLHNGRTYALAGDRLFELPASGPARDTGITLASVCPPAGGRCVLYENGDLGYATSSNRYQTVYRRRLIAFSESGNPVWNLPEATALMPTVHPYPYVHGHPGFVVGPRFPKTKSDYVVWFDPSVGGDVNAVPNPFPASLLNQGFHLGATLAGGYYSHWRPSWVESPSGLLDGKGRFQTWQDDRKVNYGGSNVWAVDEHIVYGYHGEFHIDPHTGWVGQANQYMHFLEDGLFIGQFGKPLLVNDPVSVHASPERAGNALSNILVRADANADALYWYHNDESHHGGVHRWRIGNLSSAVVLTGQGVLDSTIPLQPRP